MIKIWFLMALVSYVDYPQIAYKGFGGYLTEKDCEEKRVVAENDIADIEYRLGRTAYVQSYCMEAYTFPSSLDRFKESQNETNYIGNENIKHYSIYNLPYASDKLVSQRH
jgi:hypothetical protein